MIQIDKVKIDFERRRGPGYMDLKGGKSNGFYYYNGNKSWNQETLVTSKSSLMVRTLKEEETRNLTNFKITTCCA